MPALEQRDADEQTARPVHERGEERTDIRVQMTKLLIIAPSLRNTSPGSRFRIEQWIPHLERAGVSCTYAGFEDERLHEIIYTKGNRIRKASEMIRALGRRARLTSRVRDYDIVFLYEEAARIGPAVLETFIKWRNVPVVYDFCDPIYLPYVSPSNRHLARLKCFGKTKTICRLADHVLVGHEELAEYARQYNDRVDVVPITIDTDVYRPRPERPSDSDRVPVIGWSGSHSTVPHLDRLRKVLASLARLRRFRLEVVGAGPYKVEGVETESRAWSHEREVSDLQGFDIGIMPLPDDRWTRLRSHLKVRQYFGVGVPAVVSPVGVNKEVVEDGVNGFWATNDNQWLDRLVRLIDDVPLRHRMGRAARITIQKRYSAETWANKVLRVLEDVVQRRAQSPSAVAIREQNP